MFVTLDLSWALIGVVLVVFALAGVAWTFGVWFASRLLAAFSGHVHAGGPPPGG